MENNAKSRYVYKNVRSIMSSFYNQTIFPYLFVVTKSLPICEYDVSFIKDWTANKGSM